MGEYQKKNSGPPQHRNKKIAVIFVQGLEEQKARMLIESPCHNLNNDDLEMKVHTSAFSGLELMWRVCLVAVVGSWHSHRRAAPLLHGQSGSSVRG